AVPGLGHGHAFVLLRVADRDVALHAVVEEVALLAAVELGDEEGDVAAHRLRADEGHQLDVGAAEAVDRDLAGVVLELGVVRLYLDAAGQAGDRDAPLVLELIGDRVLRPRVAGAAGVAGAARSAAAPPQTEHENHRRNRPID